MICRMTDVPLIWPFTEAQFVELERTLSRQRLESSELVRQAYGYGLFTDPVELVVKRAAMLL